jgi:serine/threonine protein kinase
MRSRLGEALMTSDFAARSYAALGRLGPGSRIAGYVIEEQIGAGGMAMVFRARDEVLGRLAAVKVMAPALANDEDFRARFLRESRAVAAVDEQHVIPVYAAGEASGLLYIATRFVAGGDLATLLRRAGGALRPERAASLISQIASALDAAHDAGLVHRDVKPGNILVETGPRGAEHAYLSDFGLSKGSLSSTGLTSTGQFLGTPDYCPPEQIRGGPVDRRADQYALACVAFVLLTGTVPFRRDDTMAVLFAHCNDAVPPLTALRPGLPAGVNRVVARGLAKSPADRYRSCGEFAAAFAESLLSPGHETTVTTRRPRTDDRHPVQPRAHVRVRSVSRTRRGMIIGSSAALLAVGAVAAFLSLHALGGSAGNGQPTAGRGSTNTPTRKPSSPTGGPTTAAVTAYTLFTPSTAGGFPIGQYPIDLANAKATAQLVTAAARSGGGGTVRGNPVAAAYTLPAEQVVTFVGYQGTFSPAKVASVLSNLGTDPNSYAPGPHGGVLVCFNTATTPSGGTCVWVTSSTIGITGFYTLVSPETLNSAQAKGAADTVNIRDDVEKAAG